MCKTQIDKLCNTILELNAIEEELDKQPQMQNDADTRISDILHYLEINSISTSGAYSIVKELKQVNKNRRHAKQLIEINKTYTNNKNKLLLGDNRKMLVAEINKTYKNLQNEYKPRIYTKEELDLIAKKNR